MLRIFIAHAIAKKPDHAKWWCTGAYRTKIRAAIEATKQDTADTERTTTLITDLRELFQFILPYEKDPPDEEAESGPQDGAGDSDGEDDEPT
jgi:hypothetical protein